MTDTATATVEQVATALSEITDGSLDQGELAAIVARYDNLDLPASAKRFKAWWLRQEANGALFSWKPFENWLKREPPAGAGRVQARP
jgi:hypothetical protein